MSLSQTLLEARLLRLAGLALVLASVDCSSALGIEDASCDPALSECHASKASDAVQSSPLCEEYCDSVLANCQGAFGVYVGRATCLSVCRLLPEGGVGDTHVNSVRCRLHQAQLAAEVDEPGVHCPGAGPGGDALCGSNCDGLCTLMLGACRVFDSEEACQADCRSVPDQNGFNISQSAGNSLQCRLWHASAASQADVPHCVHASGSAPCTN